MSSSTPSSSTARPDHKDAHPYAVKTTQTGVLVRSNSSKAHGSWARHHYTPSSPSPSAKRVFNPSEASVSPTRDSTSLLPPHHSPNSSLHGGSTFSNPSSPSKTSKTWPIYTAEGVEVQLPRHPYLWTPSQLSIYLSAYLKDKDGEILIPEDAERILEFILDQRIGGRAFFSLDEEDFQELEGLNWDDKNALWDAACVLRQHALPYRASRISSTSYKRGRVKGIVDVFERSASESSDVGEDDVKGRASPSKQMNGHPFKSRGNGETPFLNISESESDAERIVWTLERRNNRASSEEAPEIEKRGDPEKAQSSNGGLQMTTIISPPSEIPIDAVMAPPSELGGDESPSHDQMLRTEITESEFDNETPHISQEIDISSIPPRHDEEEPTMAELYQLTYGEPAPSSRIAPVEVSLTGTTMRVPPLSTAQNISRPPTALRPVKGKERKDEEAPPVPGVPLGHLFIPSSVEHLQNVFIGPSEPIISAPLNASSEHNGERETDLQTIAMLRARLEHVEQRLLEVEQAESQRIQRSKPLGRSQARAGVIRKKKGKQPKKQVSFDDDLDLEFYQPSSRHMRVARDIFYGDSDGDFGTTFRTWQSTYILLAGATTGASIVLLPMLLRHLWTK